ncbi:beta strand repeat-containing protein [Inquilinus sp. CA228]|uniref:beta strand repeat-containing protein n=1 Tax=Inquilinus sp. CA228 TaxID=3455609 RepID=UPI003F8CF642
MTQTLNGTAGNDTLTGTDPGNPGNPDGIDIINGLDGNDTLTGLGGNDTISGGLGTDILDGGIGSDTASYENSNAGVTADLHSHFFAGGDAQGDVLQSIENLTGSAFADTLRGDDGANVIDGGDGNDLITGYGGADAINGGAGVDTVYYFDAAGAVQVNLATGTGTGSDAQGDTFTGVENVYGSNLNDTLVGDGGNNVLYGATGNDGLAGFGGADVLDGGAGIDTVYYDASAGGVAANLTTGRGSFSDAAGDFYARIENVYGSNFNDTLSGTFGNNALSGAAGNDAFGGFGGADAFDGGAGVDIVYFDAAAGAVQVNLATGTGTGSDAQGDTFTGIENLYGSNFSDTLSGDGGANVIDGGEGNDVLEGLVGADTLQGGNGSDTASYAFSAAAVTADLNAGFYAGGDAQGDVLQSIENLTGSAFADTLRGDAGANVIDGGGGNDAIAGYAGADAINGGAGVDTVYYDGAAVTVNLATGQGFGGDAQGDTFQNVENVVGAAANDTLIGSAAANSLSGGAGNDAFAGYGGADAFDGGAGIDIVYFDAAAGAVQVNLATGTGTGSDAQGDTFIGIENVYGSNFNDTLSGDGGANVIDGGEGNDVLEGLVGADALDGGDGIDTVYYDGSTVGVQVNLATGTGTGGDAEGDTLSGIENIVGSGFDDVFFASAAANSFQGGAGIDTVTYAQSTGTVTVNLGGGAEGGWAQGDSLLGVENLIGSVFADTLRGNGGDNVIDGGGGGDVLEGRGGADTLNGGAGGGDFASYSSSAAAVTVDLNTGTGTGGDAQGDTLIDIENVFGSAFDDVFFASAAANGFNGLAGFDRVSYAQSTAGIVIRLAVGPGQGGWAQGDGLSGIEHIIGSAFADILSGDTTSNSFDGGAGDDALAGESGADTLIGGAGIDTAYYDGSAAGVQVSLATGAGVGGDAHGDTLSGIENLVGSGSADILTGSSGANSLNGAAGNDLLRGGAGADALIGGAGVDTADYAASGSGVTVNLATGAGTGNDAQGDTLSGIENLTGSAFADRLYGAAGINDLRGGGGDDTLRGGADADVLDGGAGSDFANYQGSAAGVVVNLLADTASGGDAQGDQLDNIENLYGSSNADQLTGSNARNILGGELGDDTLVGNGGDDALSGEAGNDSLSGGDGADRLVGGAGIDTIRGGIGNDSVDAGSEADQVFGEAGDDNLLGGDGNDRLDGGDGNDTLEGAVGSDTLIGGAGIDTASYAGSGSGVSVNLATGAVSGGAAGDTLSSIEQVLGSAQADTLTGNAGANMLWGMGGGDVLTGGGGADVLKGGAGADRFVYAAIGDSTVAAAGKDTIRDFSAGDRIDLSAIDANGASPGDTAFAFGTGPFTAAGQVRVLAFGDGRYGVYLETSGNRVEDSIITVFSDHTLTAADFVL